MRNIRAGRWLVKGPGGASPGRKKSFTAGRPLRSGWRPATGGWAAAAMVPALIFAAAGTHWLTSSVDVAPTGDPEPIAERGSGHGRGLGQYGALDYAKKGWSAEQIVAHYYPDATIGTLPTTQITVRLQGRDDKTLDVYSDSGLSVAGRQAAPGEAVHLTPTASGADVTITAGCTGNVVWEGQTDNPWVDPIDPGPDRPAAEHLTLCDGDTAYRGSLGVALDGAAFRTVNYVDIEDYLLAVVPVEMQPNWADQGGAEALRAQAIAARSYAAAETRTDYAQTCDTTDCQVYGGSGTEDERTTTAVESTRGVVLMKGGAVLRAEYSASSDADGEGEDALASAPPASVPGAKPDPTAPDAVAPGTSTAPMLGETEVVGPLSPIDEKYRELGGLESSLGAPVGPEFLLPEGAGKFRIYANGVIVWTEVLGARAMDASFLTENLDALTE